MTLDTDSENLGTFRGGKVLKNTQNCRLFKLVCYSLEETFIFSVRLHFAAAVCTKLHNLRLGRLPGGGGWPSVWLVLEFKPHENPTIREFHLKRLSKNHNFESRKHQQISTTVHRVCALQPISTRSEGHQQETTQSVSRIARHPM